MFNDVLIIPEATKKGFVEVYPGQCFDYTFPKSKTRRGRLMIDKSNCLTASPCDYRLYLGGGVFRKLTAIEFERLQTVPDNYTVSATDSQRRKMLGNGWTIDVIKEFLKNMKNQKPIIVLSLFDGMSCGQLALKKAGIPVKKYFASEIDKYAIKVTMANFTETVQLGSVTGITVTHEGIFVNDVLISSEIPDLLIGGSPCQGFSFAGKQLNFDDSRSALFFEYERILKEIIAVNPGVKFLLENVKMKKEYQDVISGFLGVQPIEINSALVSAQNRKRLYWTNIEGFVMPEDKGILLKDIIHEFEQGRQLSDKEINYMLSDSGKWSPSTKNRFETYLNHLEEKHHCLTANFNKGVPYNNLFEVLNKYIVPFEKTLEILRKEVDKGKIKSFKKDSGSEVYYIHGNEIEIHDIIKCELKTLTDRDFEISISKDGNIRPYRSDVKKSGLSEIGTVTSVENKSVTISASHVPKIHTYVLGCITPDRTEKRQNGQRFSDGKKFYTLTAQDKHGILIEGYIRKLTPVECERLQTVPDGYTECVSDTQRYRMLGNGWTVDVIVEFLKNVLAASTEKELVLSGEWDNELIW